MKFEGIKISGTGMHVPSTIFTNEKLEKSCKGVDANWTYENLGIKERRVSMYDDLHMNAIKACQIALNNSNIKREKIDLILCATCTNTYKAPSFATLIQDMLYMPNAAAMDINAVCSGFIYSLITAFQFIHTGMYKNILVVGTDSFSTITDWGKRDCVFFGDGAGAVIVSKTKAKNKIYVDLGSDGSGRCDWYAGSNVNKYFHMNAKAVFNAATSILPISINKVLSEAKLTSDDIDIVVPHQPGIKVLKKLADSLKIPFEKIMTNMDKYANTSAATIPILLHETLEQKKIKRNDKVLFTAFGAGWVWGSILFEWV
jgi:3-oxoacyl-[acyl-carrier-protein] synthase-3